MSDAGYRAPENVVGIGRRRFTGRTLLVLALGAFVLLVVGAISAGALVAGSTTTSASPTPISYVCVNKSTGQLFYLASCAKSQTKVEVTSTSTQFKACSLVSNGVTRKVSDTTRCSDNPRKKENTITRMPADSESLYFCVKSSDGTMYFKGTSADTSVPTCPAGQYAVSIAPHDVAPSVSSTLPVDNAANIAVNKNIDIKFSEPVIATTSSFTLECPSGTSKSFTVSGSGTSTITLDPASDLPEGTSCTVKVIAAQISDTDPADPPDHLVNDHTFSFTTDRAPTVTSTTPVNGSTGIDPSKDLTVKFSEAVNADESSFTLECPSGTNQSFTVSGSGTDSITLHPTDDLPGSTICTVTVLAAWISDVDGGDPPDHLAANHVFSFRTADAAPTVTSTTPTDGADHVATDTDITVNFSEPVTTSGNLLTLECPTGTPRSFSRVSGASTITITPMSNLPQNTTCRVTVDKDEISDTDTVDPPDTMAADYVFSFTTDAAPAVTSTTPDDDATDVDPTDNIIVNFNEAVDVNKTSFTLECPSGTPRDFSVSGSGTDSITIDPDLNLPDSVICSVGTVAANISDVDGGDPPDHPNQNESFSFATHDEAPSVTSTTPDDAAGQIAVNKNVTINFSEPVDATTDSFTLECPSGTTTAFDVSGSGTDSITLTPNANLPEGTVCAVKVIAAQISDTDPADPPDHLANDYTFSFTTDAAPAVTGHSPTDGATDVAANENITFTFSEPVTVGSSSFTIDCGGNSRTFEVSGSGTDTITLNPDSDLPTANCTVTAVAANISDSDGGDPPDHPAANTSFSFTTKDVAPTVTSTSPTDTDDHVAVNSNIVVNFSEPVTASGSSFTLECPSGTTTAFGVSGSGTDSITLDPTADIPEGTTCTVKVVASNISDTDGVDPANMEADYTFSFETDAAPTVTTTTPADDATEVDPSDNIIVNFDEAVDVTTSSFTIDCGGNSRTFEVSGSGTDTITLNPDSDLPTANCTVTAVAANISDSDGGDPPDHPAANTSFSFTTRDAAPTVTNTSPVDGADSVSRNTTIDITFNEPVTVAENAFTLECPSGTPTAFTRSGSGSSYTLTPDADLPVDETCTVTVDKDGISDTDTVDPPDNMANDYTFSFKVAANLRPTDITLGNSSVDENQQPGTTVGTLSTTDPDAQAGDTFTYSLVSGTGSTDNASFQISGDTLQTNAKFDFETKSSYSVRVRTTDSGGGTFEKVFTITVTDANDAPTGISLTNNSIDENKPSDTTIGSLTATDSDTGQTHTFTLENSGCGGGSFDNGSFTISGGDLKSSAVFNYEAKSSYTICVRATDDGTPNQSFDKQFTITINDVNDAPVVTTAGGNSTFTEDGSPVAVDDGLTVADSDSANLSGATVSITSNFASGQDELQFTNQNNITGSYNATTGVLTLTGNASVADYQTALRSITFRNTSQNPSNAARTVSIVVNDGSASNNLSNAATRSVNVTPVNDAPVLTQPDGDLSYTEDTPTENHQDAIAPNLTVADVDSTNIQSATVQITGNYQNGQDVLSFTAANGISGSFDATTGKLTLTHASGTKTLADYQTALRNVKYSNTSDDPSAAKRTVTFIAKDSDGALNGGSDTSNSATRDITVTPTNDNPVPDNGQNFNGTNSAVGNTSLVVNDPTDGAPSVNGPKKSVSGDILDGDTDVDGPGPLEVVAGTFATNDGGSVTIESDGDFTYVNDPADACTDTSDFFNYTLTDKNPGTAGTATGRVDIAISGCVWYVSNNAPGNSGTSTAPFDTLAQAQSFSGAGHSIFVFDGDNTTTGYAAGINLKANQKLIGEAANLVVGSDTLYTGDPTKRPTITDNNDDVVALDDANEVRGLELDPQGTGGGIAGATGDTGTTTIDDIRIIDNGAAGTQPGLELDSTTGTFNVSNLTVDNSAATGTTSGSIGVRLNNAGTVNFAPTGTISVTTKGARGLEATGATATPTNMGAGSVFDDITVTGSDTGGVSMSGTTGTTTFGDGTGTDLNLTTTSGTTPAFNLSNAGTVAVPSGGTANVSATGGPAVDISGTSTDATGFNFDDVDSIGSTNDGINLDGLGTGTFSATSGDISGAAGISFDLNGGSGNITYPGNLNNGSGATAEITGRSGGAVALSGPIADTNDTGGGITVSGNTGGTTTFSNASKTINAGTGNAVVLGGNTGHTINFTGGNLDIDTTSGTGFSATGGGTVNVTGLTNTIDTTTGTALNVANTNIGANGLTYQRISAGPAIGTGPTNGIVLNNTGTSGGLTVTGNGGACADAATCTGGAIQNTTGDGISLTSTRNVSLNKMLVKDTGATGILGTGVTNFVMAGDIVDGAGDAAAEHGVFITNLLGTSSVTNSSFQRSAETQFKVRNTTATVAQGSPAGDVLTMSGVTFGNLTGAFFADNIQISAENSANMHFIVNNASGANTIDGGITGILVNASSGGNIDNDISNTTITNGTGVGINFNPTSNAAGVLTKLWFDVHDNTITNRGSSSINATAIGYNAQIQGLINNNTITASSVGNGITIAGEGQLSTTNKPTATISATNNTITGVANGSGIDAGATVGTIMNLTLNNNHVNINNALNLEGIHVKAGSSSPADNSTAGLNTVRLNMLNNDVTVGAASGQEDYRVTVRGASTFQLQDFVGSGTSATDVSNWITTTKQNKKFDTTSTPTTQVSLLTGGTPTVSSAFSASAGAIPTPVLPSP